MSRGLGDVYKRQSFISLLYIPYFLIISPILLIPLSFISRGASHISPFISILSPYYIPSPCKRGTCRTKFWIDPKKFLERAGRNFGTFQKKFWIDPKIIFDRSKIPYIASLCEKRRSAVCFQGFFRRWRLIHSNCPYSVASDVQCSFIGVISDSFGHESTFHTA